MMNNHSIGRRVGPSGRGLTGEKCMEQVTGRGPGRAVMAARVRVPLTALGRVDQEVSLLGG